MKSNFISFINNSGKRLYLFIGLFVVLVILVIILLPKIFIENNIEDTTLPSKEDTIVVPEIKEEIKKDEVVKEIPLPIGTDRFTIYLNDTNESIANNLFEQGYISNVDFFVVTLSGKDNTDVVLPGAYKISKEMNNEQLVQVLNKEAYMKWVIIPEGLRKEEIGKLLGNTLKWSKKQNEEWTLATSDTKAEYFEGVYFPNTYLIPVDESPESVANRLISKFNDSFAIYLIEFTNKNIKWTSALTLASIVQREASSKEDTPLIAGILWNRLNQNMQLGVDATLQYARGDVGNGWWAPISVADKKIDSPYNTYTNKGLPPHPISNPGISAIEAVLNPTKTDCLYYIHDREHITHCAMTYEEHQANIQKYLVDNT